MFGTVIEAVARIEIEMKLTLWTYLVINVIISHFHQRGSGTIEGGLHGNRLSLVQPLHLTLENLIW